MKSNLIINVGDVVFVDDKNGIVQGYQGDRVIVDFRDGSELLVESRKCTLVDPTKYRKIQHIGDDRVIATDYLPVYDGQVGTQPDTHWCPYCHGFSKNNSVGGCACCGGLREEAS